MQYSFDFSQYLQLKQKLHRKQVKARFKGTIFKSSVFKYSYPQGAVIPYPPISPRYDQIIQRMMSIVCEDFELWFLSKPTVI